MTEQEWLECADPMAMLTFMASGKAGKALRDRKFRLLACACCRSKRSTACPQGLAALVVAEGLAEGKRNEKAREEAERLIRSLMSDRPEYCLIIWALARRNGWPYQLRRVMPIVFEIVLEAGLTPNEEITLFIKDIFGPLPFRPTTATPASLTSTVISLAKAIYDNDAFDRLPILGDALEDAGCTNDDILNHCRQPGEHVRGCWVVDAILEKK